ncbi:MAG: sulfatase-like hydrolase/transferase [Propionibacteriaceae bacterium]|jgi:hypothetical protein|nr:sulfatase-like hydrolase/transferase [Propionibacteriaceae bacterium]
MECTLKLWAFGQITVSGFCFTLLFSIAFGFLATGLCCLGKYFSNPLFIVFLAIAIVVIGTQAVYYRVFKTFMVVSSLGNAKMVIAGFGKQAVTGTLNSWPAILSLLAPLILWLVIGKKIRPQYEMRARMRAVLISGFAGVQVLATMGVMTDTSGLMSARMVYSESFVPELSVKYFGALTTMRIDITNLIWPSLRHRTVEPPSASMGPPVPDQLPVGWGAHQLDIDFAGLANTRSDPMVKELDQYFAAKAPTYKNAYTGMFEGKNIVWIVAESFSSWALDATHTPTLYNLAHSGFVFNNFYVPGWGVSTSDGEYTTLFSLLPKPNVWSMYRSSNNYLPFVFGNQLKAQGYKTLAFHAGTYDYYDRDLSLPNMGYDYYASDHGLDLVNPNLWPTSDVEMVDASAGKYVGQSPFNIYYITISGHQFYTFNGNMMSYKHMNDVADLPYSEGPRAYIAAQMEFDQALANLIARLEASGELDDTVFVISGDHYPYGLEHWQIEELNGGWVDPNFGLYKSTLIIWSADMTTPVVVDKPCYAVDVLPTLSNLFDLPYDSRLLMGRDILSRSESLVVFGNHSWLTDKGRFDSYSDTFTPAPGADFGPETANEYARRVINQVELMFKYSAAILDYNYYRLVL